ncbi:condensin subunit Smc [Methylovorus glucosotrophus]|uniref:chromosome segregation protein SMC n=1 Tax=Methylovorus glucosotrophus TaxID=266009 RepID=UPI001331802F|nr:chromosome segregation protein SMC [Methylovorus glucosotrophus]KAF0844031.1 condensin subunit Smc [Methylovorus glucosotrophus]
MRLTHLKLAGFKSFVDPTTLHIHGQRVGVVGPNGCGKSNVMESIRWVLGESSAKEMRGDSMDAVIFNGSANRKPISRASVELIFDNSLGGAGGEWAQYAEISVKRVIERDKGSSYYINNSAVRRRDVADLFLGTGLGGRAYAIIGQNTISRIIEAKPEEMRVFLEEAAGISKYKERRRETELRLRDTRENLLRVDDIRQEMVKQITRLESQAVVTLQYHELQKTLKLSQGQLWLLRKRDASNAWEKTQRQVEKMVNDLEAQMAALRHSESEVETLRQRYQETNIITQQVQTLYYESNAELARLEQQVKHTQEARDRLQQQLQQIEAQRTRLESQQAAFKEQLAALQAQQQTASTGETEASAALATQKAAMPDIERAFQAALHTHSAAQRSLNDAEQSIRLETTSIEHMERSLAELSQRERKLETDRQQLSVPDENVLSQLQAEHAAQQEAITTLEQGIAHLRQREQEQQDALRLAREALLASERLFAQTEAQVNSLSKIQQSLGRESQLESWLKNSGIASSERLWQQLKIADGWEVAVEAALGARLNTLMQNGGKSQAFPSRPPAAVTLGAMLAEASVPTSASAARAWPRLLDRIDLKHAGAAGVLADWLSQIYIVEDDSQAEGRQAELQSGEMLINRHGDIYTRYSVSLHAAKSELNGVLERQRELDALNSELPQQAAKVSEAKAALLAHESTLQTLRQDNQQQQQALRVQTQQHHQRQLEIQRLQQQRQHALERGKQLAHELETLRERRTEVQAQLQEKQNGIKTLQASVAQLQEERQRTQQQRFTAENALAQARANLQKAEREAQEQVFNNKLITNNINDLNNRLQSTSEEMDALVVRQQETDAMLAAAKMDTLKSNLEQAVNAKQARETELAAARDAMTVAEQGLQVQEQQRMQIEQSMHPMRDRLEQARLAEQQARLQFEQCQQGLEATGLDEAVLGENLPAQIKASDLERKLGTLNEEIEALGPVNLAAVQELESEKERKQYLDSQATDLDQAIQTLEDAIRRIDRETRSRLQQTFDEANRHFGELFASLFGGGQARLELLGDEILDTGMQVFAQPPGKKNSTIHLLSGGEKALTALALVFALFRLNPAPFCLMDEVDAPLDDSNTERFCAMVKKMSERTQFLFVSHNKITMEMAQQMIGVTMQESGVSRVVEVDMQMALQMHESAA